MMYHSHIYSAFILAHIIRPKSQCGVVDTRAVGSVGQLLTRMLANECSISGNMIASQYMV